MKEKSFLIIPMMFLICSCSDTYKRDLGAAYAQTKLLAANSAVVSEQVENTWSTAIFDRKYSFGTKSEYVSDFSAAITMLKEEPEIIAIDKSIDSLKTALKASMEKLNDPPSKYKDTYNSMVALYSSVTELANMAIDPSGSLQTYRQNLNDVAMKVNTNLNEIEVRNPQITQKNK